MTLASFFVELVGWWLTAGAAIAAVFLVFGMDRIDEDARGAYAFRPLLIPGVLLIWPLVLWRWMRLETQSDDVPRRYRPPRAVHLPVSLVLAVALVFAVIAGLSVRQTWPAHFEPTQLSEERS